MEAYKIQIIETAVALAVFLGTKFFLRHLVGLTVVDAYFKRSERKEVIRLINLLLFIIFFIIVSAIWSVKQENLLVFISTLLTVLGAAMFTEMSILSNVTACLILFFQHPVKLGDTITITLDGKEIEGELMDISYFFVFVKTTQKGILTIPNALLLKSSFSIVEKSVNV